ncbi:MAG: NADH:flavin oxidoreductase [Planctomycetes bacterium]|nr:NADH:flavin oxidoreductase [Planctomycetota bacterium]
MAFPNLARHRDAAAFRGHLRALAPELDCALEVVGPGGPLAQPAEVAGLHIGNRFTAHPMEGWDGTPSGLPTAHTLRRWRNFGRSGCKLVWGGEAFAVCEDGRANPHQLYLNDEEDVLGGLVALREQVVAGHNEVGEGTAGLVTGLQLTHSGRWARPTPEGPAPRCAFRHPVLDPRLGIDDDAALIADEELPGIVARYVAAAQLAQQAGFDFVDLKCCHGYLLHEFLAARSREGAYGGSFENRTRLLREIVAAVRAACPGLVVGVRVSIADVYPFAEDPDSGAGAPLGLEQQLPYRSGFGVDPADPLHHEWSEPFAFLALLQELDIRLVNLSLGSPYTCPHLSRPATFPPSDGYPPPEDPLLSVAGHLRAARRCKAAFPGLWFVGTGYSYLQEWLPHVAEHEVGHGHVDSVGLGRLMLAYPELPLHLLRGEPLQTKRLCRTFSDCTTGPRHGMISGCFPLDPYYREMAEAEKARELRRGRTGTA